MLQARNWSPDGNDGSFKSSILVLVLEYKTRVGDKDGGYREVTKGSVTLHGVVTQTKMGDPGRETWMFSGQPNTSTDTEKPVEPRSTWIRLNQNSPATPCHSI
jgi:hypothetical protein